MLMMTIAPLVSQDPHAHPAGFHFLPPAKEVDHVPASLDDTQHLRFQPRGRVVQTFIRNLHKYCIAKQGELRSV